MVVWVLKDGEILPIQEYGRRMRTWLLADALLARGHRVTWWASTFSHQRKTLLFDRDQVCEVQRHFTLRLLDSGSYDRNVSLGRYLHHRRLGRRFRDVVQTLQPPDAIVCAFPVIDLAYYSASYAKALGIPLIVDVRDLWPDTFLDKLPVGSQWLGRLLFAKDFRRTRYTCAAADSLISISQGCLDWALIKAGRRAGPADRVFHTGYPDGPQNAASPRAPIRPEWSGKVLFTFVGSFGSSYNLRSICDVAETCLARGDDHVHFVLAGDGDQYADIVRRAARLPNVTLTGWIGQEALRDLLNASDVGLAPLRSVRDAMPNKPYEYFAAGLPILSSLEGEMEALIERHDVGFSYRDGDVGRLLELVLALAGDGTRRLSCSRNARALYESRFRSEDIYAGYARHVEEVVGGTCARSVDSMSRSGDRHSLGEHAGPSRAAMPIVLARDFSFIPKRAFDLTAAAVSLILLAPLFFLIALAIKAGSRGPVFYRGVRIGLYGRPFRIYKFRTMVPDAETRGTATAHNDRRITAIGTWLRLYKLDELPQLINILKGEMSLVGPRPEVEEHTSAYSAEEQLILTAIPGITDLSSIRFIRLGELLGTDDPNKVFIERYRAEKNRLRLEYVRTRSFWLDLKIIVLTLWSILTGGLGHMTGAR